MVHASDGRLLKPQVPRHDEPPPIIGLGHHLLRATMAFCLWRGPLSESVA